MLGGVQWGSAVDDRNIYVALSDLKTTSSPRRDANTRPSLLGGLVDIDPKAGGGLFALRLSDGNRVWTTPHPGCTSRHAAPRNPRR